MTLFNQPLLTVNPLEMMKLWGELIECYHGVNGYGSDTAQIYAYRLMPYDPVVHTDAYRNDVVLKIDKSRELCDTAANALVSLCEEFARTYDCKITIDGMTLKNWLLGSRESAYDWRCHVKVVHK